MRYAALLVATLMFVGCSTYGRSTFVEGTFHTPQPNLTLNLSGYDYLGQETYTKDVYDPFPGSKGETYHVFGEKHYLVKGDRDRATALVTVDIQAYPSERRAVIRDSLLGYLANLLTGASKKALPPGALDFRKDVVVGNAQGFFLVKAEVPDASVMKFPLSKGYTLPDCMLVASWILQGGAGNQYDARIDYYENLPETLGPCKSWAGADILSEEQERYLSDFEARLAGIIPAAASSKEEKGALQEKRDSAIEQKLRELKRLLEEGLITKEEYDEKRKETLERF